MDDIGLAHLGEAALVQSLLTRQKVDCVKINDEMKTKLDLQLRSSSSRSAQQTLWLLKMAEGAEILEQMMMEVASDRASLPSGANTADVLKARGAMDSSGSDNGSGLDDDEFDDGSLWLDDDCRNNESEMQRWQREQHRIDDSIRGSGQLDDHEISHDNKMWMVLTRVELFWGRETLVYETYPKDDTVQIMKMPATMQTALADDTGHLKGLQKAILLEVNEQLSVILGSYQVNEDASKMFEEAVSFRLGELATVDAVCRVWQTVGAGEMEGVEAYFRWLGHPCSAARRFEVLRLD